MAVLKVKTKYGTVTGLPGVDPEFSVFKGIPYAKKPVGELRLMPPVECEPWEGELLCDKWGDSPVQDIGRYTTPGVAFTEDCLKLNIWTPAKSADEKLPVMVFFYGGGFNRGDSCYMTYDGEGINRRGVIHVNVNYRVAVLGFLALKELSDRSPSHVSGNYGLLDMIMSLKWVKENISFFGGDPDNVTIFGQSAGAMACRILAGSPLADGLFKRVIVMSGSSVHDRDSYMEDYQTVCHEALDKLGWTVDDILTRDATLVQNEVNRTMHEILDATGRSTVFFYRPCIDGWVIPDSRTSAGLLREDLDVMVGSVYGDGRGGTSVEDKFENKYEVSRAFAISSVIANAKRAVKKPLYTYFNERVRPSGNEPMPHGADLPYFFDTLNRFEEPWTAFDREICRVGMDYFTNFAKYGDPNGEGLPVWKPYTEAEPFSLNITDSEIKVCELLNTDTQKYIFDCLFNKKDI